jgi:hypothetical protein
MRENDVLIEVPGDDRARVTPEIVAAVDTTMRSVVAEIGTVQLDPSPYRMGRAVLKVL